MSKRSWIRNLFAHPVTRPTRKAPHRFRPTLEALEDRLLLTTFTVSQLVDDGLAGSLRWAITQANTNRDDDIINFSVTGTINLHGDLPNLNNNLAIQGPGAGSLTVRRDAFDYGIFHGFEYRIFLVSPATTVAISGLTIANGRVMQYDPTGGGGIANFGTLTVSDCILSGNSTVIGGTPGGGGIWNIGTLTVSNSILSGNTANTGTDGGGGGIYNRGRLTVSNSTLSANRASLGNGAGIYNDGTATVSNSTLSANSAPSGGGIYNVGALTVSNSTLSGNLAIGGVDRDPGGGIYNGGGLTVSNSTLSGNEASIGGGIYNLNTLTLNNSLVVNSRTGGTVQGSFSGSHNLLAVAALGPLQLNGGPTPTHALLPGSPAINAGSNASIPADVTTDQRALPRIVDGTVDIGAYEVQPVPISTTAAVTTSAAGPTYGDSVTFTATVTGPSTPTGSVNFVIDSGAPVAGFAGGTTGATATWTYTTQTLSAGTHTIAAFFVGSGNFAGSDGTLSGGQLVNKANATVVVTPYTVSYDGLPHTATVASIAGVNGQTGAAVGAVTLSPAHTTAGTYADSWSFIGGPNYNNVAPTTVTNVINKAASAVAVTVNGGPLTYSGLAQTPATVLVTGAGGLSLTPAASYANNVNAGTGTASYTYAGDANHTGGTDSKTFAIGKANAAVVVTPYNVSYDGLPHTATVTSITGVNGQTGATVGTVNLAGTTHTAPGRYADTWTFTGTANYNNIAATAITNTITPTVSSVRVNDGTAQRSQVTSLTVTFSAAVVLDAGAITLAGRSGAGAGTALTWSNPSGDAKTWVVKFAGTPVVGGSLADGVYDLTVVASKVHATPGGATMSTDVALTFHRLLGDLSGDRRVSFDDLVVLAQHYNTSGKSVADGDLTGDGNVDFNDLVVFAQRYNTALPQPAVAAASVPAIAAPVVVTERPKAVFSTTPIAKPAPAKAKPLARRPINSVK